MGPGPRGDGGWSNDRGQRSRPVASGPHPGPPPGWDRPGDYVRVQSPQPAPNRHLTPVPVRAGLRPRPGGPDLTRRRGAAGIGGGQPWPSPWQLPDRLPTSPTLLVAALVVLLAFLVGHATGGGGGSGAVKPAVVVSATTTTTVPALPSTHTVAAGETLSSIASLYGIAAADLASYNGITNLNHVFVGEILKIPPPTTPTSAPTSAAAARR